MIVESWPNEVAENKSRGTIFSIYATINMAASTLGQLAMSVTWVISAIPFVVGAIALIAAVLPTAPTSTPRPKPLASAKLDIFLLYRDVGHRAPGGNAVCRRVAGFIASRRALVQIDHVYRLDPHVFANDAE